MTKRPYTAPTARKIDTSEPAIVAEIKRLERLVRDAKAEGSNPVKAETARQMLLFFNELMDENKEKMSCAKLAANCIFANISAEALAPICDAGEVVSANRDDRIIEEGEVNAYVYLILSGEVEVCLPEIPERLSAVRLGARGAGACIGEYAFIDKKPASATVTATMPTELFRIPCEALESLLDANKNLERIVYRNMLLKLIDQVRISDAEMDLFLVPS
jgi:CRP-like cAMP-binding protein